MSRILELPDHLYDALLKAAVESGTTPQDWIASHLSEPIKGRPQALADRFAGRVGRIRSGSRQNLSENYGTRLTEHLQRKRAEGHL